MSENVAECGACDQVRPLQSSGYCIECDTDYATHHDFLQGHNDASDNIQPPAFASKAYMQGWNDRMSDRDRQSAGCDPFVVETYGHPDDRPF